MLGIITLKLYKR